MVTRTKQSPAPLSRWVEDVVRLPPGLAAEAGPIVLHPHQGAIADAMGDPAIERVSVLKSARVGFSTLLVGLVAHHVVRDAAPVLWLMPTEADCRGVMVDDVEGVFGESPQLRDALPMPHPGKSDRNTLLHRMWRGGSLKLVAGKAPRNLRRHSARVLLIDEVDAIEASAEGDPVTLATRRTLTWPGRKIVVGGTPLDAETSTIARLYAASDRRVFEVPCAHCRQLSEIRWSAIEWPPGEPERASWRCPSCRELIPDARKPAMVKRGKWRTTRPTVKGHAGFRVSALVSLLPNCSWPRLAAEYESAKDDPALLRVFVNTVLGEPWDDAGDAIDDDALRARAEPFSLDAIPGDVLALTCGVDCQDDRLEAVICGWSRDGTCYVLAHETIHGDVEDDLTWSQLDELLRQRFPHPSGGTLGIDACAVDGSDGGHLPHVLAFCRPRAARRVLCIKGAPGFTRIALAASKAKMKGGGRLWIVGVDTLKSQLFARLARGATIRFSSTLEAVFYEQLTSERIVMRTVAGKPVRRFERLKGQRAESLDATTYSFAARAALNLTHAAFDQRASDLATVPPPPKPAGPPPVIKSQWMERGRWR